MPVTSPVFVCSDGVYVFASKEQAESWVEPANVEPATRGYDAEGRLLRVLVHGEVKRGRWSIDQRRARVELVLAEEQPGHRDELRTRLTEWLRSAGDPDAALAAAELPDLVTRVVRRSAGMRARDRTRMRRILWSPSRRSPPCGGG